MALLTMMPQFESLADWPSEAISITSARLAPTSRILDVNDPLFRIVLADELLPVQAFFNALPDDRFLSLLRGMLDGIGIEYNGVGCVLPGEDDESAPDTGVLFYAGEEEKWLPNSQVAVHFGEAIAAFAKTHAADRAQANTLLDRALVVFR